DESAFCDFTGEGPDVAGRRYARRLVLPPRRARGTDAAPRRRFLSAGLQLGPHGGRGLARGPGRVVRGQRLRRLGAALPHVRYGLLRRLLAGAAGRRTAGGAGPALRRAHGLLRAGTHRGDRLRRYRHAADGWSAELVVLRRRAGAAGAM